MSIIDMSMNWIANGNFEEVAYDSLRAGEVSLNDIAGTYSVPWLKVNHRNVLQLPQVTGCLELKANSVGRVPMIIEKSHKEVPDHPLRYMMMVEANEFVGAFDFKYSMDFEAELKGNAYAIVTRNGNNIRADKISNVGAVKMWTDNAGQGWYTFGSGKLRGKAITRANNTYKVEDVIHLKFRPTGGYVGEDPIKMNEEYFSYALSLYEFMRGFLTRSGRGGAWILSERAISTEDQEDIKAQTRDPKNASGVILLQNFKGDAKQMVIKPGEAEFANAEQHLTARVASLWSVPSELLGDKARAIRDNVLHQRSGYINHGLMPRLEAWKSALRHLLNEGEEITFDVESINKGTSNENAKTIESANRSNTMGVFERRDYMSLDPTLPDDLKEELDREKRLEEAKIEVEIAKAEAERARAASYKTSNQFGARQ